MNQNPRNPDILVPFDPDIDSASGSPTTLKSHILEFLQTLVVFLAIGSVIYLFAIQPHKVSGCSMCPNFHTGDFILTDKVSYRFKNPERGDVVVFKNPRDNSQDFIKRIIGIPGDKVMLKDGKVYLNGSQLNEPYLDSNLLTNTGTYMREGVEITVEENKVLTFGDNRPGSSDSREWGQLPEDKIIGKAFIRYWPKDVVGVITHYKIP